ncbi:MAG: hypothetical protein RJA36_2984 [Pseudomonadota bacterium]
MNHQAKCDAYIAAKAAISAKGNVDTIAVQELAEHVLHLVDAVNKAGPSAGIDADLLAQASADEFSDYLFHALRPSAGVDNNWHVTDSGDMCVAHCYGFGHDVLGGRGLALRIVAALNYCHGIHTAHLVGHSHAAGQRFWEGSVPSKATQL